MIDVEIQEREGSIERKRERERNREKERKRQREQSLSNFYELGYMSLA